MMMGHKVQIWWCWTASSTLLLSAIFRILTGPLAALIGVSVLNLSLKLPRSTQKNTISSSSPVKSRCTSAYKKKGQEWDRHRLSCLLIKGPKCPQKATSQSSRLRNLYRSSLRLIWGNSHWVIKIRAMDLIELRRRWRYLSSRGSLKSRYRLRGWGRRG
jgi:hypothetical protein